MSHELLPWHAEPGQIDVHHETPVVPVNKAGVARRHDQAAHVVAKAEPRSCRQFQEQLGAAPLVRGCTDIVDRVVEPQCDLDGIAIVEQRRHLVETAQAIPDVIQVVKAPVRGLVAATQLGVNRRSVG